MRVISVINQKGGVGKTTTTFNLAHALAMCGQRVIAVDLDPQGHLSASFGASYLDVAGSDELLIGDASLPDLLCPIAPGLQLLAAGPRLGQLEHQPGDASTRIWRLRRGFEDCRHIADFVLADCPPSAGFLAMSALFAADEALVPVPGDYLALQAVSRLIKIIRRVDDELNRCIKKWFVLTRFHPRRRLARQVRDRLHAYFPGEVLATPIRELVALAESPAFAQSIFAYKHGSQGAADYRTLAADLLAWEAPA